MKLIVFDVEGTIFKATMKIDGTDYPSTMWQPIAEKLGEPAVEEEKLTHAKWESGQYNNYIEWVKDTIKIHEKYSLRRDDFNSLIDSAEYNDGVEEFFSVLNRNEWLPVLISGGFQNLIRRAQSDFDIEYGFGACEYFFDEQGYLYNHSLQPSDFEGKIHFVDTLLKTFNLNKKTDWVFVGDGKNDFHIAKQAPIAFGINPHEKLKSVEGLIEIKSFVDILNHLDKTDSCHANRLDDNDPVLSLQTRPKDDISKLTQQVIKLKIQNRKLKQEINDMKGKKKSKENVITIPIEKLDYEKTPRKNLQDLLPNIRVTFLGLDENSESYRRLKKIPRLNVIPGMNNRFDVNIIRNSDFLFIYKNCITHSDVLHALNGKSSPPPCCYLLEPTNSQLLENAIANVLYKYLYQ